MNVYCTFRRHFNAGHRLHNPQLDDEANRRLYGKCNNPHGHGHNYAVEVTLKGVPDETTGRFIDLDEVCRWFDDTIVSEVDHRNLNVDVPFMKDIIPTAENLAQAIWSLLAKSECGQFLYEVKLFESENNAASVRA